MHRRQCARKQRQPGRRRKRTQGQSTVARFRPAFELLEQRQLLSIGYSTYFGGARNLARSRPADVPALPDANADAALRDALATIRRVTGAA